MKQNWKPGTMIYPLPAVLVSCGATPEEYNLLTVAWTGTVCSDPAMCYVSIRRERHSYEIIRRTGEFVINLTTEALARATDWCGVRSGRDYNKFAEMGLTAAPASVVSAPVVEESPVAIECRVKQIVELGSHDMFLAEVVNVQVDEQYVDQNGRLDLERARPLVYSHGEYFGLGELIGGFGWSVRKKPTVARIIRRGGSVRPFTGKTEAQAPKKSAAETAGKQPAKAARKPSEVTAASKPSVAADGKPIAKATQKPLAAAAVRSSFLGAVRKSTVKKARNSSVGADGKSIAEATRKPAAEVAGPLVVKSRARVKAKK